jgi:hypothetical protein
MFVQFSTKNPLQLFYLHVKYSVRSLPDRVLGELDETRSAWPMHKFVQNFEYGTDDALPFAPDVNNLLVFQGCYFAAGSEVVCHIASVPLSEWLLQFPAAPQNVPSSSAAPRRTADDWTGLKARHPWLESYAKKPRKCDDRGRRQRPLPDDDEPVWEGVDAAWAELLVQHDGIAEDSSFVDVIDFFYRVRGESWSDRGGSDFVITEPKKGVPRIWCKKYKIQQAMSFKCADLGDPESTQLAGEVCNKLQFFIDIYKSQENPDYVYTQSDLDSCIEPEIFQLFSRGYEPTSNIGLAIARIRAVCPLPP